MVSGKMSWMLDDGDGLGQGLGARRLQEQDHRYS